MSDEDRYTAWVRTSVASAKFEQSLPLIVQMLGRLDCELISQDSRFGNLQAEDRGTIPEALRATDRLTLSYLWVLGAYEIVRTMHQRARTETAARLDDETIQRLADAKHAFERVRVPLAKMEPARRHQDTDSAIAYPAFHRDLGTAWQLDVDLFVTRRELSDLLLDLLAHL